MVATGESSSLGQHVYREIRADILSGRIAPGTPMRLAALSKRYDVSSAVVRETLIRLAERNLLVLLPNQGFRVVDTSPEDLADITEMRALLEGLALRRSIESGDVEWEARVVAAHHILERTPFRADGGKGSTDTWSRAHAAFHEALGSGCRSPRLQQMTNLLRDSSEIYRQMSMNEDGTGGRDVAAEHRELRDLAIGRRADEAVDALHRHLQRTADAVGGLAFRESAAR